MGKGEHLPTSLEEGQRKTIKARGFITVQIFHYLKDLTLKLFPSIHKASTTPIESKGRSSNLSRLLH
jgi:hypothetical protein